MSWDRCQTSLRARRAARKSLGTRGDDRLGEVPGIEAKSRKGPGVRPVRETDLVVNSLSVI